jgi:LysR family transcriptional regulator of abg operon
MKLHHLRDVLAVAERGSLRAAARELGIAQPAVTRSIQDLERELGVPLFERRSRGVVPTPMGEAFIRRANAVCSELSRARDEIDQLRGVERGKVRIALSMVPHLALLPYALRPFRVRYPDVYLDVIDAVFPTVSLDVGEGNIDCYIGPPPEELPEGLSIEKLFDNTRVIVGRIGHPLARASSLKDLRDAEWIWTSVTTQAERELGPLFAHHHLPPPKIVMRTHSSMTLMVSLVYSDLLAMVPIQWTQFELTRDLLQTIDVSEHLPAPPICVIRRSGLPLTPAADYFCDLMRRAAAHAKPREVKGLGKSRAGKTRG